ncbi:delta-60 repeat domain-containing protein [Hymenobacter fastidiosus]|uniref:Delta-60 repeat domain-containing protein n=1 Tax=Hymenobacter fastidiosus TaxID=486264 RepID=A0ABP7SA91_9BACT
MVLIILAGQPATAQTLDPGFAAASIYAPGQVFAVVEQADGRRVAVGTFTRVNGTATPSIACFNPDGSLDATFRQNLGPASAAFRVRKANNGQLLITSYAFDGTLTIGGVSRQEPVRLNANGTVDAAFNTGTGATKAGRRSYLNDVLALPNGQTLVVGEFDAFNGVPAPGIARLTASGAVDAGFTPGTGASRAIGTIVAAPGGKLLIGGYFQRYNGTLCYSLARLNADGSFDNTFTRGRAYNSVDNIVVQANGNIILAGDLNGPHPTLDRLLPTGANDQTFAPPTALRAYSVASYISDAVQVQPDGKIVFFTNYDLTGLGIPRVGRLNSDGSLDASFQAGTGPSLNPYALALLTNGTVLVAGQFTDFSGTYNRPLMQLTSAGAPDATFRPLIQAPGTVNVVAQQPDGRLVVGGNLSEVNGQPVHHLVRFNADGSLDAAFSANVVLGNRVTGLALQPDDRVLTLSGGVLRRQLPSGLPDNTLNPQGVADFPSRAILVQPNGRILVGGSIGAAVRVSAKVVRLLPDGSRDATFAQPETGPGSLNQFETMALQPNGKILVAGSYIGANGQDFRTLVRLESNGTADLSFQGREFASSLQFSFFSLAVQPEGKILVGGSFSAYDGKARAGLVRLQADGALDAGFTPPAFSGTINKVLLQPNNRILVGGGFTSPGLPTNLLRLLPDGQADATFASTAAPDAGVHTLLAQPDGKLVAGGSFTSFGGQPRMALARITAPNVLHVATPRAVAGHTAVWPVPAHATLHVAPDAAAHAQTLDLLDALGRTVLHQEFSGASATLALDTLPAGMYLLRVTYAEGIVSHRVQVQ